MYLSLDWLKDFVNIPKIDAFELGHKLTMHTFEIDGVEAEKEKFNKVVVGKALKVEKHPNADRLKLAVVDVGKEKLNIVCGAPNLEEGQLVAVALAGAQLPNGLEIQKAQVRGQESNGMICAEDELGLGDNHDGIMVLDKNAKVGQDFANYLKLDDVILEVDNKSISNRPDLWGHYGIAREISTFMHQPLKEFKTDIKKIYNEKKLNDKVNVKVEEKELCPRYMVVKVDGIEVKPSPEWMQKRLAAVGQKPINNIVDITNYVMMELGQPLHAFDSNLVDKIVVRKAKKEKFTTLDGTERELESSMLVIANSQKAIAIAGVMGGENSEINSETSSIVIESANFEPVSVRKTAQKLGLRTESSMRFEKSLDPNLTEIAIKRTLELIQQTNPKAECRTIITDIDNFKAKPIIIDLNLEWLEKMIGQTVEKKSILNILQSLGFSVKDNGQSLSVTVPSWRATKDISIAEDLVEEIARIYGYENIQAQMPKIEIKRPAINQNRKLEKTIKQILSSQSGLFEVYNYSFVGEEQLKKMEISPDSYIRLANPVVKYQTMLRQTLLTNLLDNVRLSQPRYDTVNIFEVGDIYLNVSGSINKDEKKKENLPFQEKKVGIILAGNEDKFREVKGIVENLVSSLTQQNQEVSFEQASSIPSWADSKEIAQVKVNGIDLGVVMKINSKVVKNFSIKKKVYFAELNFNELLNLFKLNINFKYQENIKYPPVTRDLAFVVDDKIMYNDIRNEIEGFDKLIKNVELFDVYQGDILGQDKRSLAFHVIYQAEEGTLTSEEVDKIQNKLIKNLEGKFAAQIRNF